MGWGVMALTIAKRTKNYVENFVPERKNALEVLMKEILLDTTYENVICIIQGELMNHVLKTLKKYKQKLPNLKRGSNNNIKWACQSQTASGGRAKIGKKIKSSNFWSGMKP